MKFISGIVKRKMKNLVPIVYIHVQIGRLFLHLFELVGFGV